MDFVSYCDGNHGVLGIANIIERPFLDIIKIADRLLDNNLLLVFL
jgi:aminopeptidase-like protein